MTRSTMQDGMQDIKRDVKQNIKWNARRLAPYLSGVLGSYGIVRELVSLWYGGARVDARSLVLCLALWALLWTRAYGVLYLSAAVVVCLCPILHISLGWLELAFLLCSFVSARAWDRHKAIPVAGCIVTVVLLVGSVLGYVEEDAAVEGALLIEQLYTSVLGESEEGWFENGSVSRGNNYRSGGVILDVVVDKEPTEDIYLRGYVGADYEGDRWTEADESPFYIHILDLTGGMSKAWVQMSHDNLVFELNYGDMNEWVRMLQGRHLFREDARKIVLNKRGAMSRQYIPYYSFRAVNAERYYQLEEGQEVDTYFYFESADMDMEMIEENLERFPQSAGFLREEYENYVMEHYLRVTEERLPRLKALCEANADIRPAASGGAGSGEEAEKAADEADAIDAVTSFIRDTLQADTFYTRTPGNTPVNQDVIEYFLFESKRGYCMHYASAATLMYRMYGIPARYVTGYVAHPQDFKRQVDGTYAAALTDYRLHAWVEIYRENLGWTPVEMTPLSYYAGELPGPSWLMPMRTGYMGNIEGEGQGTLVQYAEEAEEEEEEAEEAEEEKSEDENTEEEEEENAAEEEFAAEEVGKGNNLFPVVFGAILAVLCAGALLWYRRRQRLEKLRQMDERRLFYRLLKFLHGTERLRGYTGTEDDFVEKLLEELPVFEEEEATELMRLVEEAAYGPERPTKEENRQQVYAFYERASEELYGRMNHLQRLYYTWILNLR